MNSIVYVGMDVHTTNYTLSCYTIENNQDFATVKMEPDYRNVLKYLEKVQENYGDSCEFRCGYEAGCLGFTLYHQLTEHNVKCVILAPSTMPSKKGEIKTDKRDAMKIARCLAYNTKLSPLSLHVEYNGGVYKGYGINHAGLFGLDWFFHGKDFRNTLNVKVLYKYIHYDKPVDGSRPHSKVPLQFTAVWGMQDLFGLKGLRFSGFADFWWERHTVCPSVKGERDWTKARR